MQVEIINPQGKVSYRRPHGHKDVQEALNTKGYSVRVDGREAVELINDLETLLLTAKFTIKSQSEKLRLVSDRLI